MGARSLSPRPRMCAGTVRRRTICGRLGGLLALASALLVLVRACTVAPYYVWPAKISPDA